MSILQATPSIVLTVSFSGFLVSRDDLEPSLKIKLKKPYTFDSIPTKGLSNEGVGGN